jgi:hypothetical protein
VIANLREKIGITTLKPCPHGFFQKKIHAGFFPVFTRVSAQLKQTGKYDQ